MTIKTLRKGFSLVELSIVLVILGLLVGGILAGQSLVRAAELRSVTTDFNKYLTGMNAFRDRYVALPGDMPNATNFWGAQDGGDGIGTDCTATASTSSLTCNGDANAQIGDGAALYERFRFWQHLAIAGLIEGTYTGVTGGGSAFDAIIGTNVPRSRMNNAGFSMFAKGTVLAGDANYFAGQLGNIFTFGAKRTNDITVAPIITPEAAWNIDGKLDDGMPGTGVVQSYKNTSTVVPGCATTDNSSTATYALSTSTAICSIVFKSGT